MSAARFEIVHTGRSKFHARFVARNGEIVWVTESYTRTRAAERAIEALIENARLYDGPVWRYRHPLIDERTSP